MPRPLRCFDAQRPHRNGNILSQWLNDPKPSYSSGWQKKERFSPTKGSPMVILGRAASIRRENSQCHYKIRAAMWIHFEKWRTVGHTWAPRCYLVEPTVSSFLLGSHSLYLSQEVLHEWIYNETSHFEMRYHFLLIRIVCISFNFWTVKFRLRPIQYTSKLIKFNIMSYHVNCCNWFQQAINQSQ